MKKKNNHISNIDLNDTQNFQNFNLTKNFDNFREYKDILSKSSYKFYSKPKKREISILNKDILDIDNLSSPKELNEIDLRINKRRNTSFSRNSDINFLKYLKKFNTFNEKNNKKIQNISNSVSKESNKRQSRLSFFLHPYRHQHELKYIWIL